MSLNSPCDRKPAMIAGVYCTALPLPRIAEQQLSAPLWRLPKPILEQLALGEEVESSVRGNQLVIRPGKRPRSGWEEHFRRMAEHGDDRLLDAETTSSTKWDEDQWE